MGKNKQKRFDENKTFSHLFQPSPEVMYSNDFELKGRWSSFFFKNENPIILEIGCGKGEYTVGLARLYPENNYIGIDIKGARLWKGSKAVLENNLLNVAFIRNKVEFLGSFFRARELSEIWITFPDPQARKAKKRLTSGRFLQIYSKLLKQGGLIHLKTDSRLMYEFTIDMINCNDLNLIFETKDLYQSGLDSPATQIQTYYERKFLSSGMPIYYIQFTLNEKNNFVNPKE